MKKSFLMLFITLFALGSAFAADGTRFLHQPDISADKIVFEYGGDLWIVPVTGGEARHLTTHPGNESSPKFSPDGRWIAFTGSYDGNSDVFVIPAEGGVPRRVTYHPGSDNVRGWSPDGSKIMFNSSRDAYSRSSHMFTIDFDGGLPEILPMPMASLGDYAPDGVHIAYTPNGTAAGEQRLSGFLIYGTILMWKFRIQTPATPIPSGSVIRFIFFPTETM